MSTKEPASDDSATAIPPTRGDGLERTIPTRVVARLAAVPPRARTALCVAILSTIAWMTFVAGRGEPASLFWDENYYLTSTEQYVQNIGAFEAHPPLGKLFIALGEVLSGTNATINKRPVAEVRFITGDVLPKGFDFNGVRLMPALFGAAGAIAFFGLMLTLLGHRLQALLFSSLFLFENAYQVHFRAVHLDSFQVFFCVAFLWLFVALWRRPEPLRWRDYADLSCLAALAVMVKVNAVLLFTIFPALLVRDLRRRHPRLQRSSIAVIEPGDGIWHEAREPRSGVAVATWRGRDAGIVSKTEPGEASAQVISAVWSRHQVLDATRKTIASIVAATLTATAVFVLHLLVGSKMPDADSALGQSDIPHMSPPYRDYLEGRRHLDPLVVATAARDYVAFMRTAHTGVPPLDPCKPGEAGSHPLEWIVHRRPISYRWDSDGVRTSYVQLVGNPISWLLGFLAVLYSAALIVQRRINKVEPVSADDHALVELLAALYAAFMAVHLIFITHRVMYLYHYFIGLLITFVLVPLCWRTLMDVHRVRPRGRLVIVGLLCGAVIASWAFFLPLTNHWPLTRAECERRNVLQHVVDCR